MIKSTRNNSPIITVRYGFPKGKKPFVVPLYGGIVYFCTTREEFAEVYNYMTVTEDGYDVAECCLGCVSSFENQDGASAYIMGVFDGVLDTYVHELGHLAIDVLDRAGCPIDSRTSEAFCYLIGTLAGQFQDAFVKSSFDIEREKAKERAKEERAKKREKAKAQAAKEERDGIPAEAPEKPRKPSKEKGAPRDRS